MGANACACTFSRMVETSQTEHATQYLATLKKDLDDFTEGGCDAKLLLEGVE